jgi:hypothetical protein
MNEELDILFDQYLNNELSVADKISFDERIENDIEFKEAFELHQLIITGIQLQAQNEIKSELSSIYTNNQSEIDNQPYQPTIKGFNFFSFLVKSIFWLIILSSIYILFSIYTHKTIIKNKWIETKISWIETKTKTLFIQHVDTVYYYNTSTEVALGDTITTFPDKQIIQSKGKSDTVNFKPKKQKKIVTDFKMKESKEEEKPSTPLNIQ